MHEKIHLRKVRSTLFAGVFDLDQRRLPGVSCQSPVFSNKDDPSWSGNTHLIPDPCSLLTVVPTKMGLKMGLLMILFIIG